MKKWEAIISLGIILMFIINIMSIQVYAYEDPMYVRSESIYYIKNKNSGKYLDVQNAETLNGTNVWQYTFNGSNAQKWKIVSQDGYYTVESVCASGKYLDIYNASSENGANVHIW